MIMDAATERFSFGKNWRLFLDLVDEQRVAGAVGSLRALLGLDNLIGRTFLDIGSGSGLFSLAARRLGAKVHSFDADPFSVGCTAEMRARFSAEDALWTVEQGSVLDDSYLAALPQFDVVYSWGVLHHTGDMWRALEAVVPLVKPGGHLIIATYNDQGRKSEYWKTIKKTYCQLPDLLKPTLLYPLGAALYTQAIVRDIVRDTVSLQPLHVFRQQPRVRGMSAWRDLVDWVSGYPFEVAKPGEIVDFYLRRGFSLCKLNTVGGSLGNNEFVFARGGEVACQ